MCIDIHSHILGLTMAQEMSYCPGNARIAEKSGTRHIIAITHYVYGIPDTGLLPLLRNVRV